MSKCPIITGKTINYLIPPPPDTSGDYKFACRACITGTSTGVLAASCQNDESIKWQQGIYQPVYSLNYKTCVKD